MNIKRTKLDGVVLLEAEVFADHRGFFMESFNEHKMAELGFPIHFVQDNHSLSIPKWTLRGLHYQLQPKAQTKLVRVIAGSIYDVVVDLRKDSATFGKWEAFHLSADNKLQLLIPKGFAHGFCTLEANTEVLYKVDDYYSPEHDRGILWNDPDLNIAWPTDDPILSDKDRLNPPLKQAELNF